MEYQQVMPNRPVPPRLHGNVTNSGLYVATGLPRRLMKPSIPRRALTQPRVVTTAQIVARLGVTTLAVGKWREGSRLRPPLRHQTTRQGRANRVLIHEADLLSWLKEHRPDLLQRWLARS